MGILTEGREAVSLYIWDLSMVLSQLEWKGSRLLHLSPSWWCCLEVVESFARDLTGRHSSMEAKLRLLAWFSLVSLRADL